MREREREKNASDLLIFDSVGTSHSFIEVFSPVEKSTFSCVAISNVFLCLQLTSTSVESSTTRLATCRWPSRKPTRLD